MSWIDYLVLLIYLAATAGIGLSFSKGQKTGLSYFLGDRSVHWVPAGITMTAVSVSTITFIGMPGQSYGSDWTFLQLYMILPLASWIVSVVFLPVYIKYNVTTAYEFLEHRFDVKTRLMASALFQLIICVSTGVVIYAPAIMLAEMSGFSVAKSIWIVGIVTTIYTMFGGIKSVIYTDILQTFVFMTGWLVAVVLILLALPGGFSHAWTTAVNDGKLRLFNFSTDLENPATIWAGLIAMMFVHLALNGVNQAQVQKYLSVSNQTDGRRAIMFHGFGLLAVYVGFFALGTLLYVFYKSRPDSLPESIDSDHVFPYFIIHEVPVGLRGFLIAGGFAAAMSTLSSALNSLANVTVVDFIDRFRPGNTVLRAKVLTVIWAGIVIAAGLQAANFKSILKLGLIVNSYFYGCLLGVFLLGMASKRATGLGAVLGLVSSLIVILLCGYFFPGYAIWFGAVGCIVCMVVGQAISYVQPSTAPE